MQILFHRRNVWTESAPELLYPAPRAPIQGVCRSIRQRGRISQVKHDLPKSEYPAETRLSYELGLYHLVHANWNPAGNVS